MTHVTELVAWLIAYHSSVGRTAALLTDTSTLKVQVGKTLKKTKQSEVKVI